jgi:YegS/Rv2252/BmrU family lipid kinase
MRENEVFVILNPQAAKGKAKRQEAAISAAFAEKATLVVTEEPGGAEALAHQAAIDGWPVVVAAGGDGTVNEVVNGICKAAEGGTPKPKLGIIPVGRGNDFAWAMKIPRPIEEAVAAILGGRERIIDVALMHGGDYPEGRWFINGLGVGFEPLVNFEASSFKRISGVPSYVLALIKVMINYPQPYDLEIVLDGKSSFAKSQQLSVCNGRRMGSAFLMAPDSLVDDGLLDVVYANVPIAPYRFLPIAVKFFKGNQVKLAEFTVARAKTVVLRSRDNPMPVHVDGEEVSRGCMEISIRLHAASIVIFA